MKTKKNLSKRGLALFLALVMCLSMMNLAVFATAATTNNQVSDARTDNTYDQYVNANNIGYVWSDKTVDVGTGNSFDVTYSLLSSATTTTNNVNSPLDVVFIVDVSGSMISENVGGGNRMHYLTAALNQSIKTLMDGNAQNRVAVVVYGNTAATMLSLGRYKPAGTSSNSYFSMSGYVKDNNGTRETFNVVGAANGSSGSVKRSQWDIQGSNGTNTQAGVIEGMSILANSTTTATVNGRTVKRTPVVILLSDGQPTLSISNANWWATGHSSDHGNGDGTTANGWAGNALKAMMAASYWKQRIAANYGDTVTTQVYTVGIGLAQLKNVAGSYTAYHGSGTKNGVSMLGSNGSGRWYNGQGYYLAQAMLNPSSGMIAGGGVTINGNNIPNEITATGGSAANSLVQAWNAYKNGGALNTRVQWISGVNGTLADYNGAGTVTTKWSYPENYSSSQRPTDYPVTSLDYVDRYFALNNNSQIDSLTNTLGQAITLATNTAASYPTTVTSNANAATDGYVIYTDELGDYMQFAGLKSISWNGTTYNIDGGTAIPVQNVGNSPINGRAINLSAIKVEVTTNASGRQVVTIKVPAQAIPLKMFKTTYDSSNKPTTSAASGGVLKPLQITYNVTLKNDVLAADGDLATPLAVSGDYITGHKSPNGGVYFYSNLPGGENGTAKTTFTPAGTNTAYDGNKGSGTQSKPEGNKTGTAETSTKWTTSGGTVTVTHGNNGRLEATMPDAPDAFDKDVFASASYTASIDGQQVAPGSTLYYTVDYSNDTLYRATVTIVDTLPQGVGVPTNISNGGVYDASMHTITWTLKNVQPYGTGRVSFQVELTADAWTYDDLHNVAEMTVRNSSNVIVDSDEDDTHNSTPHKDVFANDIAATAPGEVVPETGNFALSINGETKHVGDLLVYRIDWHNTTVDAEGEFVEANVTIHDAAPDGTALVAPSMTTDHYVYLADGTIKQDASFSSTSTDVDWNFTAPANSSGYVLFTVVVTERAQELAMDKKTIDNSAYVTVANGPQIETNWVHNNVVLKDVFNNTNGDYVPGSPSIDTQVVQVGDTLHYVVNWANVNNESATVTVTDRIPDGTQYVQDSAYAFLNGEKLPTYEEAYEEAYKQAVAEAEAAAKQAAADQLQADVTRLAETEVPGTAKEIESLQADIAVKRAEIEAAAAYLEVTVDFTALDALSAELAAKLDALNNPPAPEHDCEKDGHVDANNDGVCDECEASVNSDGDENDGAGTGDGSTSTDGNNTSTGEGNETDGNDGAGTDDGSTSTDGNNTSTGDGDNTGENTEGGIVTVAVDDDESRTPLERRRYSANGEEYQSPAPVESSEPSEPVEPTPLEPAEPTVEVEVTEPCVDVKYEDGVLTWTIYNVPGKDAETGYAHGTVEFDVLVVEGKTGDPDQIDNTAKVTVENHPEVTTNTTHNTTTTGGLSVAKNVAGSEYDAVSDRGFEFTVKFYADAAHTVPLQGTYASSRDGVSVENGSASFTLHHGETVTFSNLPTGTQYVVSENAHGYTQTVTGTLEGGIVKDETANVAVTNTLSAPGSLTIGKTVVGVPTEQSFKFDVTLTLANPELVSVTDNVWNVPAGDGKTVEFKTEDGKTFMATIELAHGESITLTGIPAGAAYTVTEKGVYETTDENGEQTEVNNLAYAGEIAPELEGWNWVYNGTVSGETTANIAAGEEAKVDFTNTLYIPTAWQIPAGVKNLDGVPSSREFEFSIIDVTDPNAENPYTETVKNLIKDGEDGKTGDILFAPITFEPEVDENGELVNSEYVFEVQEISRVSGIWADTTVYTVTVELVLKDGVLKVANVTYKTASGQDRAGIVFNNSTIPDDPTTRLTVTKVWENDDPAERPASIQVQLYRNGTAYGAPVTLSSDNGWTTTWNNLSTRASWTVEEVSVPEGYIASISGSATDVTITNTHEDPEQPPENPTENPPETPPENPTENPPEEIEEPEVPLAPAPPVTDEEIEEPEVPLTPMPPVPDEEIEEPEVPLSNIPKTGDRTASWLISAILSGLGLAWLAFSGKRKENGES